MCMHLGVKRTRPIILLIICDAMNNNSKTHYWWQHESQQKHVFLSVCVGACVCSWVYAEHPRCAVATVKCKTIQKSRMKHVGERKRATKRYKYRNDEDNKLLLLLLLLCQWCCCWCFSLDRFEHLSKRLVAFCCNLKKKTANQKGIKQWRRRLKKISIWMCNLIRYDCIWFNVDAIERWWWREKNALRQTHSLCTPTNTLEYVNLNGQK